MNKLTKKDIEFLKGLSMEMKEQDSLGTASARLWVIRDVKEIPTSDDYADGYIPFDEDSSEELTSIDLDERIMEAIEDIETNKEKVNQFLERYKAFNIKLDSLNNWDLDLKVRILSILGENIKLIPYMKRVYIVDTAGSFFTQKAAEKHIQANKHHYSENVHTYCLHAWRNPEMTRVVNILENTDWNLYSKED